MAKTAFYTHRSFLRHEMGEENPESPSRIELINDMMIASGVSRLVIPMEAQRVTRQAILAAHDKSYIDQLVKLSPKEGFARLNEDTAMNPFTWEAVQYAAGAVTDAVEKIVQGTFNRAFCAVRPPGHHAHRDHSGGFCFLNNVAIGALYALEQMGLKRVAVVDFDVHHGDGTSTILGDDERVLILDSFQQGIFPYAHLRQCPSNAIYSPFEVGCTGDAIKNAMDVVWYPALLKFQPDLILVSAGFDGHREEDQAQMLLVESDYAFLTRRLVSASQASKNCRGIISVLEGGYSISSLARSCVSHIRTLATTEG